MNCKASTGGREGSEGQPESGLGVCALEESGHRKDRPVATSMVFDTEIAFVCCGIICI